MTTTKKSLLASGLSRLVCLALLLGTTFAWFTDSVTNTGNTIQAGSFDVRFFGNRYDGGNWTAVNNLGRDTLMVGDTNWEPGQFNAVAVGVSNYHATLSSKVSITFEITQESKNLADALWYKVYAYNSNQAAVDRTDADAKVAEFENVRPAAEGEYGVKTMSDIEGDTYTVNLDAGTFGGSEYGYFLIEYGMYTAAGNEYQGGNFEMAIHVTATQDTQETDGFGNSDYDADAAYPVVDAGSLKTQLEAGGIVLVNNDIVAMPEDTQPDDPELGHVAPQFTVSKDASLNLNGKNLSLDQNGCNEELDYTPTLIAVDGSTLTVEGNGTISAEAGYNTCYGINVVKGGTLVINDGNYYGAMTVVQVQSGKAVINGGFFDLAPTIKADAPQYACYLINCIDSGYKDGTASVEIRGGTFVGFDPSANPEGPGTSYVADGYKVVSEVHGSETWYTVVPE